jgi:RNA polymerase sigma factor (sigma-70 family)
MWSLYGAGELDGKTDSYILQGCYFHLKNYLRTHLDKARPVSIDAPIDESGMTLKDTLASETASGYNAVAPGLMAEGTVLRKLDEREQEVLRLLMEGLTVREIGDRLGISHVMVVKLWRRMRDKCRALRSHP